ncbi:hypothetical protein CSUI_008582, partial [Cystoisospora suis]
FFPLTSRPSKSTVIIIVICIGRELPFSLGKSPFRENEDRNVLLLVNTERNLFFSSGI